MPQRASLAVLLVVALFATAATGAGCGSRVGLLENDGSAATPDAGGLPDATGLPDAGWPDPCEAVRCAAPPPGGCVSASTLRSFVAPGMCVAGLCEYAAEDTACDGACIADRCVCTDAPFSTGLVATDVLGRTASIAATAAGDAHLSFVDATNVLHHGHHAHGGPLTSWSLALLDAHAAMDSPTSIAVEPADGVIIAYRGPPTAPVLEVGFHRDGDSWTTSFIDRLGGDGSVVRDADGGIHLAYIYFSGWELRYAYQGAMDRTWTTTDFETETPGRVPSVGVDRSGVPHIAYQDGYDLRHTTRRPDGTWATTTVDTLTGPKISLGLDGEGGVHIAYEHRGLTRELRHAERRADGTWTTTVVAVADEGHLIGWGAALAVDRRGGVHIAYAERPGPALQYAHRPPGEEWELAVIDADAAFATGMTLDIDDTGGVHVGYHVGTELYYAYRRRCL
jgi:hypothetical protein